MIALTKRTRKLIARLAAGDYDGMLGATDLLLKINANTLKLDRLGHTELADELMREKAAASRAGEIARRERSYGEVRRAREAQREAERNDPSWWMRRGHP